ncbi:MAG: O-antigen ligase family protein [Gaiellaceae bacterium]
MRARWPTLGAFALVTATGFAQGGYFPGSWGWTTLACAWAAAAALVARERVEPSKPALATAALLACFALWTTLSAFWSVDVTDTVLEAERVTVYVAAFLAAVLWARDRPERLLHGAWAGATVLCAWGLATRLVPDRWGVIDTLSGYRLSEPIGYWNALGLLAAMGALLALGIATRGPTPVGRVLGAASLPLLVTTLYFTFSRGSWIALALGLIGMLAFDARRLQLVLTACATAPLAAVSVWHASDSSALTTFGSAVPAEAHDGHRLALLLIALCIGSGAAGLAAGIAGERIVVPERSRRGLTVVTAAAAVAALVAAFAQFGSPWSLAARGWNAFAGSGSATPTLNGRLFNLSGTDRVTEWRVAVDQVSAYTLLGAGAASYEVYWNRHRPIPIRVRNVHNLYLETLADLGPLGLVLLSGILLIPLAAAVRRRRSPFAPAAFGAYLAFALHVAVDWDWQITSVTLVALVAAACLVAGAGRPLPPLTRRVALGLSVVLLAAGLYTIASRIPLGRLDRAAARGQWPAATRDARSASALAPWSFEPWLDLGEDELNAGRGDLARSAFEQAIAADDRNWVAWYDLARSTFGRTQRRALARARALNPLSPELASFGP